MQPDAQRPELALAFDMIAPEGYGEIIGGSQRIHDYDLLVKRLKEHNLPQEAFQWYLDLRRFGSVPHSGFGLGLERTVAWICGTEHIREVIPFPANGRFALKLGCHPEPALSWWVRDLVLGRHKIADRSVSTGRCRNLQNSQQPAAAAARRFEQRQHIHHAEQFQYLLARVHHFQPAAPRPRRNVQRHHRPQSRTIHHRDFFQVQHDSPFSAARLAHRVLQQRHILAAQPPKTFHHRAILGLSPLHSKSPRRTRCIVSRHPAPLLRLARHATPRASLRATRCTSFPHFFPAPSRYPHPALHSSFIPTRNRSGTQSYAPIAIKSPDNVSSALNFLNFNFVPDFRLVIYLILSVTGASPI